VRDALKNILVVPTAPKHLQNTFIDPKLIAPCNVLVLNDRIPLTSFPILSSGILFLYERLLPLSAASVGLYVLIATASTLSVFLLLFYFEIFRTVIWYTGRSGKGRDFAQIRLPENEYDRSCIDHGPDSLHFSPMTYTLGSRTILDSILFQSNECGTVAHD
jgi:hypothetical protein